VLEELDRIFPMVFNQLLLPRKQKMDPKLQLQHLLGEISHFLNCSLGVRHLAAGTCHVSFQALLRSKACPARMGVEDLFCPNVSCGRDLELPFLLGSVAPMW